MGNNKASRIACLIVLLSVLYLPDALSQEFINIRKISMDRGDTSVVAGILADVRIDKVDPNVFYYWYGHGHINANQGGYSGHLLHGEYLEYGPSGKMLLKGTYDRGVRSGHWIYWYAMGAILETREYEDGMLEGKTLRYSPDGRIIHSAEYRKNRLDGEVTTVINDTVFQIKFKKGVEKKRIPLHVFEK